MAGYPLCLPLVCIRDGAACRKPTGLGRRGQAAAGRLGGCATQELPRDSEGPQVSEGSPQPLLWPNRAPEAKTSHGDPALAPHRPCLPAPRCDVLAPGLATVPNRSAQQGPREEALLPLEQWFDISLTGWGSVNTRPLGWCLVLRFRFWSCALRGPAPSNLPSPAEMTSRRRQCRGGWDLAGCAGQGSSARFSREAGSPDV